MINISKKIISSAGNVVTLLKKNLQDNKEKCYKVFRHKAVQEKHRKAVYDDVQLLCHFYNNDKDCPYDDVHEKSENCKVGVNIIVLELCACFCMKSLLMKNMIMMWSSEMMIMMWLLVW